ncbi:MAG TPA: enoyl-CoA hydratase [Bryobacteraceae bacterium]|nr:enoyl-CoA hydratase [Bryobacteraceae bacterium]
MSYEQILYSVDRGVAAVTLNRPEKLNAWTAQMDREVRLAMKEAETDGAVRVIVLTGAGRGFCAGADMSILRDIAANGQLPDEAGEVLGHVAHGPAAGRPSGFQRKYSYFPSLSKPVIAAIHGPAVGLGLILSLYCDLRFASTEARFGTAFARRGLIAEYGVAWMLPRLVGHAHALDLLLSARIIQAEEALRMGLVNRMFPADTFSAEVMAYARDLAENVSPRSMSIIKRQVYEAMSQTLEEASAAAGTAMIASLQSEDFREGVAHFVEKRTPRFTGR